jgi:hypothetical protein
MYEKQIELLTRLLDRTKEGMLDWKPTASDDAFQVSFKKTGLRISRDTDSNGETTYTVEMLDKNGNLVDSFTDTQLDLEKYSAVNEKFYLATREAFELARRKALGADKVIDEIINELDPF